MGEAAITSEEPQHEGEQFLALLGLSEIAGSEVTTKDGTVIAARDFLDVCGPHARPALIGLGMLSPEDPTFGEQRDALRAAVLGHIGLTQPAE